MENPCWNRKCITSERKTNKHKKCISIVNVITKQVHPESQDGVGHNKQVNRI